MPKSGDMKITKMVWEGHVDANGTYEVSALKCNVKFSNGNDKAVKVKLEVSVNG